MPRKAPSPEEVEKHKQEIAQRKADRVAKREEAKRLKAEEKEKLKAAAKEQAALASEGKSHDVKVKPKKLPNIVNTKRFTVREIKVDLDIKEINEAGQELAHKQKQYAEIEEEMKGHMSNYKDRLKEVKTQMNTLGNKVTLKYEYRKFSCEIWLNFKTKERVYKDRETHKVIDTASLEADDYQMRIPI